MNSSVCPLVLIAITLCGSPTYTQSNIAVRDTSSVHDVCVHRFWPNPFADDGSAWTYLSTPETSLVAVVITDTLDNVVYNFGEQEYPPGEYTVDWRCEDNNGKPVHVGIFHMYVTIRSRPDGRAWESRYRQRFIALPYDPDDEGETREQ